MFEQATEARAIVAYGSGRAGADIVIATPGRLTAHLRGTPGFGLAALRFLVVDETDRLLRQACAAQAFGAIHGHLCHGQRVY